MNQLTALVLAAMMVTAGGAAAVNGIPGAAAAVNDEVEDGVVTDAEIDASDDAPGANESSGTVTITVMDEDGPVANASVELDGDDVEAEGVTDANGTYTAAMNLSEELEVEAERGTFTGEVEYRVENDSLVLVSEEYKYEEQDEERDDEADESDESDEERDDEEEDETPDDEHESDEESEDESDEAADEDAEEDDDDEEGEGRGPPEDVPRGPPEDVPRGPPDDVPRGSP